MSQALHDALREQGLVPKKEDVHFDACSTWYRQRLNAVSAELPDHDEFKAMQQSTVETEIHNETLRDENAELKKRIATLEEAKPKAKKKPEPVSP